MAEQKNEHAAALAELRDYALTFPGATEDFPWGECAIKVKGKVFLFLGKSGTEEELRLSVKLPETGKFALLHPFAQPTGYGLGQHGWVSARLGHGEEVPVAEIKTWIEESYRAIAPKKFVAQLDNPLLAEAPTRKSKPPSSPRKKPKGERGA